MKPKLGQVASWGAHTDDFGRVSAIRKTGFYAQYRCAYPTVPGGHKHATESRFFRFEDIVEDAIAHDLDGTGKVKLFQS